MQEACDANPSGMVSIMGLPADTVTAIAKDNGLYVSNINAPTQINVSGDKEKINAAAEAAKAAGGKAIVLNVAGAVHSPYMIKRIARTLAGTNVQDASSLEAAVAFTQEG